MADFARESMMEMFTYEMSQLLEQLEQIIIQDEESAEFSDETINEIFRIMHTIKGSAAMMLFTSIQEVGHAIEDLFFYIREKKPTNVDYSTLADIVLAGEDFVKNELEKIENNQPANGNPKSILKDIAKFLEDLKSATGAKPAATAKKTSKAASKAAASTSDEGVNYFKASLHFDDGCEMENIRAYTVIHNLEGLAHEIYYVPEDVIDESAIEFIRQNGFKIFVSTVGNIKSLETTLEETVFLRDLAVEAISKEDFEFVKLNGDERGSVDEDAEKEAETQNDIIEAVVAEVAKAAEVVEPEVLIDTQQKDNQPKKSVGQQMISVNIGKLDTLQNLTGELVMTEAMVTQNPELDGLVLDSFRKAARQLHKIINDVQDTVMSMRLVSLSPTFSKMHRIVRDMCKQLGKDVGLEIEGAETEVDKNIIEHISDPLMHIIRNAVDHGIEYPKERRAVGKPARGTLLLEAKNTGGDVLIIVKDDGSGIDKESVMKKAKANNLLKKMEYEYTEKEIYNFIMMPGFSTNVEVTSYSGRGVGMDVVQTNIDAVGGSVLIDSVRGEGTTFTLKIPLTLAIVDGMIIRLGQAKYTIPIISIKQSFEVTEDEIFTDPDGNEMIMKRGEAYNVTRLNEFFNIPTDANKVEEGIMIMIESEGQTVCILADELIGEQQVVVKSMPKYIKKIRGISGCTLLGNGDISLIVDVAGFFNN